MSKNDDDSNGFPQKLLNKLPAGFADEAGAMSIDELKKTIINSENNIYIIDSEMDSNERLKEAQEEVKNIKTPYREAKTFQNIKIKYCMHLLRAQGVVLD